MRLTEKDTPLYLVKIYKKEYPLMEKLRQMSINDFPPECYLPISAGAEVLRYKYGDMTALQVSAGASELTAVYIWRKTKVMYMFDDTLAETLAEQASNMQGEEKLPIELLLHLPYPCVYIKTGYFRKHNYPCRWDGFFVWIEWDMNRKEYELRLQFVTEDMRYSVGFVIHLTEATLGECLQDTKNETIKQVKASNDSELQRKLIQVSPQNDEEQPVSHILVALQMTLYLLSDNHDEEEDREQRQIYRRAKAKNKTGKKPDEPSFVRLNNVGIRIGSALRKAQSETPAESTGSGAKKQTHLRRGHWHHYWTGSKKNNDQKLILKWVAPMIINPPEEETDTGVVIYPVKPNKEN